MDTRELSQADFEAPEPAWDIAHLFPAQGAWSEDDYLALDSNRLIELSNGSLEVLVMPTTAHQRIVRYLHALLFGFASSRALGEALFAPLRVRLWPGKIREPDILFMMAANAHRIGNAFWEGADLVMEIVNTDDRRRDLDTKRREYAQAGIAEYWIVDAQAGAITVLKLDGSRYFLHGAFRSGERASSHLLPGFEVEVAATFAAGEAAPGAQL